MYVLRPLLCIMLLCIMRPVIASELPLLRACSSMRIKLVFPEPQSPNTPTVTGAISFWSTTFLSVSTYAVKPRQSSIVSLSDHILTYLLRQEVFAKRREVATILSFILPPQTLAQADALLLSWLSGQGHLGQAPVLRELPSRSGCRGAAF